MYQETVAFKQKHCLSLFSLQIWKFHVGSYPIIAAVWD